jgi:hypothetical protein
MFSNQIAMRQVLGLWHQYERDRNIELPHGLGRWKSVFNQLHTIRFWNETDRVSPELIKDWDDRIEGGSERVPFEVELWYFQQPDKRVRAEREVRVIIEQSGGAVAGQSVIEEIEYHAITGDLPVASVRALYEQRQVQLFRAREIMYVRPAAQAFVPSPTGETELLEIAAQRPLPNPDLEPVVAILDGMPIENHPILDGRLAVDDPDGWAAGIGVADRQHGTAMASLVVHGDLARQEESLGRRVYVRPILQPENQSWNGRRRESVPDGTLFVDIVHRAVARLFANRAESQERIYIVNLSVGDYARQFVRSLSPCARLLDWLAWKYQVLFIVSAGNHGDDFRLDIARDAFISQPAADLEREVIRGIEVDSINRRLLSPAESINAVTVASLFEDGSIPGAIPHMVLAFPDPLASPYNALGFGYRRAVKPDVLYPGGRFFLQESLRRDDPPTRVQMMVDLTRSPGQCVAAPAAAVLSPAVAYSRGTSNACAIATRTAARIYELLHNVNAIDTRIPDQFLAVTLKTLVIHGASWGNLGQRYETALTSHPTVVPRYSNPREYVAKYIGNGAGDYTRAVICNADRVTVLGHGVLPADFADVFTFPLPPALSGQLGPRRLIVTLSWITPINTRHYNYRRAQLWFSFPDHGNTPDLVLPGNRLEVHSRPAQRGTIQHEVFSGAEARVFANAASLRIWVNCRADAGSLEDDVPYCIAVTLEAGEELGVPVYEQVAARVRQPVRVRPR